MIINGVRWRVFLVSPAHPMLLTPHMTHALGVCDKVTQSIYIDETLTPSLLKEVVCHELVHAFMFSYKIDLTYNEEEMVAELMASHGESILKKTNAVYKSLKQIK